MKRLGKKNINTYEKNMTDAKNGGNNYEMEQSVEQNENNMVKDKETTPTKKGVVSLHVFNNLENGKGKTIAVILAIAFIIFGVTIIVQNIVSNVVAPSISAETEIDDLQFLWGDTAKNLDREDSIWKQANKENKIEKISSSMDYVKIKVDVPASEKIQYYTYYASFAPSKVVVDGSVIYNNGFDKVKVVGNTFNKVSLSPSTSTRSMEIYIYSPVGFNFKIIKSETVGSWYSNFNGLGLAFAFGMFILAIAMIIMLVTVSVKDKNIVKVLLLSVVLFISSVYFLMYQLGMSTTLTRNGIFYSIQLILSIYLSIAIIMCSLGAVNYKIKMWNTVSLIAIAVATLLLVLVDSQTVLLIIGIVVSVLLLGMLFIFLKRAAYLIEQKRKNVNVISVIFSYITLINMYNIISLVTGTKGINRNVLIVGITIYVVVMYVILFRQSVNYSIKTKERKNQYEESAMSVGRIAGILSDVADALTDRQFAMHVSQIFTDVIARNEIINSDMQIQNDEITIPACVAIRKDDGTFEEILNNGDVKECNYEMIESMYNNNKQKIKFGLTYMDLVFVRVDQVQIIFHIENFENGMSEMLQSTIKTIHNVLEIAFSNYNLKTGIKTVQEDSIISLAEMVEYKGRQNKVHLYSVSAVTKVLCEALGFSEEETHIIAMAAIAHDIGKMAIPNEILNSDSKLTDEEYELMKKHVVYGYNILSKNTGDFMEAAAVIAYQHHENYDGTGYMGIVGEDIHIYARIVRVADVFDALASDRAYKKAWDLEKVREYILDKSGIEFDPKIVKVFDSVFDKIVEASKNAKEKYRK